MIERREPIQRHSKPAAAIAAANPGLRFIGQEYGR